MKKAILYIVPGLLFGLTATIGVFLTSVRVVAEETVVDNVAITVPKSCTLTAPSGAGQVYSETMSIGQYKDDIGSTTLTTFCNNNNSFAIYAIGYSDDTFGNTEMIASNNGATNIPTGTATVGNTSQWAMKVEPTAGSSSGVNIENGFNNFSKIPSSYTTSARVASVNAVTGNTTNEAEIKTTYAVYISPTQASGSYTGKVRYTVIQPSSEVPKQPIITAPGKIGYYPNAPGVVDSMSEQSISDTDTSASLWPSNFKRSYYGFAGWTDKYDWVVGQNDANGNGIGVNAGYHIYGPNQTINFTAGQYSGSNDGLSLYAVWVESKGILQTWNGCGAMNVGEVIALEDERDSDTYAVAKLADGKCWMIENLRLGMGSQMDLFGFDTNIPSTSQFILSGSQNPAVTGWCVDMNSTCFDQSLMFAGNKINTTPSMTSPDSNVYSYGGYYNWYSAIAGTRVYSDGAGQASGSICPKGWHLPTGGSGGEFAGLNSALGNNTGVVANNLFRTFPNNFLFNTGRVWMGGVVNHIGMGAYWSSTAYNSDNAYPMYISTSGSIIKFDATNYAKNNGLTVRCIAGN